MTRIPLRLAASLRVVIGLVCMSLILLAFGKMNATALWPPAAQAHLGTAFLALLLATISGAVPLLIYFEGLRLTKASTAGYFEMMQTLAAVAITWGFFHAALHLHQVIAALVLMAAVFKVQKVQAPHGGASSLSLKNTLIIFWWPLNAAHHTRPNPPPRSDYPSLARAAFRSFTNASTSSSVAAHEHIRRYTSGSRNL